MKCDKCHIEVGYMDYYCRKCRKKLAGDKPRKSRDLCSNCTQDYYNHRYLSKNPFGGKGCMSYTGSKVVIKNVYHSKNTVVPTPQWRLECFNYDRS